MFTISYGHLRMYQETFKNLNDFMWLYCNLKDSTSLYYTVLWKWRFRSLKHHTPKSFSSLTTCRSLDKLVVVSDMVYATAWRWVANLHYCMLKFRKWLLNWKICLHDKYKLTDLLKYQNTMKCTFSIALNSWGVAMALYLVVHLVAHCPYAWNVQGLIPGNFYLCRIFSLLVTFFSKFCYCWFNSRYCLLNQLLVQYPLPKI